MTFATCRLALITAACGLALFAAPSARAFTVQEQGAISNGDGTRSAITDPDNRSAGGQNGQGTLKQGNPSIQFGGRPSFDRQFNTNQMFDPASRLQNER